MKQTLKRRIKINIWHLAHKIGVLSICLLFFFTSCQNQPASNQAKTAVTDTAKKILIDTTKPVAGTIDTGSKKVGATQMKGMFAGNFTSASFKHEEPLRLGGIHDTTISGVETSMILLSNCQNVTIRNCKIGSGHLFGIGVQHCSNITIDRCYVYMVPTGFYIIDSRKVSITNCQGKNMMGPFPRGQFVQFRNVSGGGNRISFNKFESILNEGSPEDAISLYASKGLPNDPIVVEGNWIRGGGPSRSGGGIMLGDGGGSYQVAKNNFLVDPGQYGMAVSGGSNMSIVNNTIYAKAQSFTTEGIYYRNYTKSTSINVCIAKNAVNYTNSKGVVTNTYLGPGNAAPRAWNTNIYDAGLNANILPAKIVSELVFKP